MNQELMGRWIMGKKVQKRTRYSNNIKITWHEPFVFEPTKKYMLTGERFLPEGRTQFPDSGEGSFTRTGTYHCLVGTKGKHTNPVHIELDSARLIDDAIGIPDLDDPLVKDMM